MAEEKTVITLICERAADVDSLITGDSDVSGVPGLKVVKYPCSGMIQPLMVEAAMKAGASGVIVCGCQIGDCYYREGNKMIRERLLGGRPPGLKKTVDRRRVLALWLARPQKERFLSEAKEFVAYVHDLDRSEGADAPAAKPQAKKPAEKAEKPEEKKPVEVKAEPKADSGEAEKKSKEAEAATQERSESKPAEGEEKS